MRRVRMGSFLLQRGLLIYILAPESCDSYMIILQLLHALFGGSLDP